MAANLPFRYRWDANEAMGEVVRFKSHSVALESADDFELPQRLLHHGCHHVPMAILPK